MAREINGTTVLLTKGANEVVGQMEVVVAFAGVPIDISNKSNGDDVTLINGEVVGQQMTITGTIVYNSDTEFRAMRAAYLSGAHDTYNITYTGAVTTQEKLSATCQVTALSDAIPHGDKVATSITLSSSGAITHTVAV